MRAVFYESIYSLDEVVAIVALDSQVVPCIFE